jgi:deoxycytidylate deaminase
MALEKYYSLRKDFVVIALTGRTGAGCSNAAQRLCRPDFISSIKYEPEKKSYLPEDAKFKICFDFLRHPDNWEPFKVISYKNVLLLQLVWEAIASGDNWLYIQRVIIQHADKKNPRFCENDDLLLQELRKCFDECFNEFKKKFGSKIKLHKFLKTFYGKWNYSFTEFFFGWFHGFCSKFYEIMDENDIAKRITFNHDLANDLRKAGSCLRNDSILDYSNVYTMAHNINQLIKLIRKETGKARVIIDPLKNSIELMYFKEKFSAFYMVAINNNEDERKKYIKSKSKVHESNIAAILKIDEIEYDSTGATGGDFRVPDIENCIQKSDYHIFHSGIEEENEIVKENSLNYQMIKLLALITHPGLITPTPVERTMQIAVNAKYNSGCISRQVGAVVTDQHYSVKSIGWNDVAQNQMPCKLRSVEDLVNGESSEVFSPYEKTGGDFSIDTNGSDKKSFKDLVKEDVDRADLKQLEGRPCPFCFKAFQNAYEGEKNQVHTRSLHAEENAMMQIAKNGGEGLKGGFLFTTASPCELCSKKAFQLGVRKIYYIDPYPGIALSHTLKNGVKRSFKKFPQIVKNANPEMRMFKGAVGSGFHKLYEPFMSYKDEIKIRTNLKPTPRPNLKKIVGKLTTDPEKQKRINEILNESK